MAVWSCCYEKTVVTGFDVGEWWNNEPDMVKVCSVECKDKLWNMVQDGTWMDHKPKAMFPEYHERLKEEAKQDLPIINYEHHDQESYKTKN